MVDKIMRNNRLESFSDGVLAIIITVMVLEMKVPQGADQGIISQIYLKDLSAAHEPICNFLKQTVFDSAILMHSTNGIPFKFEHIKSIVKKLRAWHKFLIALLITISSLFLFGPTKLILGLIFLYLVLIPISYLLERRNKLSLWQERLILGSIVYPVVYLFVPVSDVLSFFIGFLIVTAIFFITEEWGVGEKERLPDWEDEEGGEKNADDSHK